jgi:hypothetical protein
MVWILPVQSHLVNSEFDDFECENDGEVVVKWVARRGCAHVILDVHYLGLELSELGQISGGSGAQNPTCCV